MELRVFCCICCEAGGTSCLSRTLACSLRVLSPKETGLLGEDVVLTHLLAAHPSAGHLEVVFAQAVRAQRVMRARLQQGPDRLLQFEDQVHIPYSQRKRSGISNLGHASALVLSSWFQERRPRAYDTIVSCSWGVLLKGAPALPSPGLGGGGGGDLSHPSRERLARQDGACHTTQPFTRPEHVFLAGGGWGSRGRSAAYLRGGGAALKA